ncbi:restriction endonuclease subunit S [Micromonospora noduli]|uniref:restriction endonuclease subunit S n=1 Tax=Micromonospora noduli TaxID=709876 RepID=UPI000DC2BF18|nr:restriction endonuclease subunit S [Micromonospora noduli]RAO22962.1 Type I site-specific deoxyribonuclease [Micromonospora noduli]
MSQGRNLVKTKEQITQLAVAEAAGRLVQPGTVLLSFKLSIGKVGIAGIPLFTNEAIAALPIRQPGLVLPQFLYWALRTLDLTSNTSRAAMGQTLNKAKLQLLQVPLPPVHEQRRIAEVLDRADELRAKRREALAHLNDLTRSIFLDMFATEVSNTWPTVTVADVADQRKGSIRTGPFGSQLLHSEFVDDGVAVLGIDNAVSNEFRWDERRFISEEKYQQLARYTVHPGDVLITIMGTCGRCAVVPDDIPRAINTKHLCCITLDAGRCLPEFLHRYFLTHPAARRYLQQTAKGAIMAGLNMEIIKAMPVVLPPLALQQVFVKRLRGVERVKAAHRASLAELDGLFGALQDQAFRGLL